MKGIYWYDIEWCIRKGSPMHLNHFTSRAIDTKDIYNNKMTAIGFKNIQKEKIKNATTIIIKEDVRKSNKK